MKSEEKWYLTLWQIGDVYYLAPSNLFAIQGKNIRG